MPMEFQMEFQLEGDISEIDFNEALAIHKLIEAA
jgi:hypothetical protein